LIIALILFAVILLASDGIWIGDSDGAGWNIALLIAVLCFVWLVR